MLVATPLGATLWSRDSQVWPACKARGQATFTNGRRYRFDANFAHSCVEGGIFVSRPADGRAIDATSPTAQAIRDGLGLTEIAQRERDAIRRIRVRARHRLP